MFAMFSKIPPTGIRPPLRSMRRAEPREKRARSKLGEGLPGLKVFVVAGYAEVEFIAIIGEPGDPPISTSTHVLMRLLCGVGACSRATASK